MLKIICLTILVGFIVSTPLHSEDTQNVIVSNDDELNDLYRLSDDVIPTFYDVILHLDPNQIALFGGFVEIRIISQVNNLQEIKLHAFALSISSIRVVHAAFSDEDEENLYQEHSLTTDDTQFLTIRLESPLRVFEPYVVRIEYVGEYADDMFGLYISRYQSGTQTRNLVASQLQPTYARRVFPCFDEPHLKAVFRTTIYAPAAFTTVRSNTPLRETLLKPPADAGYIKYEFEDTLRMSTYLQAYIVSDFEHVSNDEDPLYRIPFHVYARPNFQQFGDFALRYGQQNMVALEHYTNFPYAFPKLDKVAVPDFAAGAMENWGLVIYREVALLYQEGVTSTSTLQNIGRIITHENMHMWFGNEVSPRSWTYTWLNEGFANFFESFGTNMVRSDWRMMDQFVINMQNVFQADAVLGVNPMTHAVYTPSQVIGTFNAVAYQKSGSVIRMLQHFLTPPVFQRGLSQYLLTHSRRAATPADLYASLQQALDESEHSVPWTVETIMTPWENQGGFPVLTVRRSAVAANSVSIGQERFLTDNRVQSSDRWNVPVNWVLSTDPDFENTAPQAWISINNRAIAVDIPGLSEAEWFIFNKQQTGYYRVNYDRQNWVVLSRVLSESTDSIHLLNRAQLVDDAFNLARNGRLDYDVTFELTRYLVKETDYIPWAAANAGFNYLENILSSTNVFNIYQRYLLYLTAPAYATLGFEVTSQDTHVTPFFRNIILGINCRYGNQHCVDTAETMLADFINDGQALNPDIQTTVYCSGLRGASAENFDRLWTMYLQSTDSSEQTILLNALGCTSNAEKREFYLSQTLETNSEVREQDRHSIVVSVINSGPNNLEAALDFVIENFAVIQTSVQGLSGTSNILNALSRTLTSEEHLEKINDFATRYSNIFSAAETASVNAIKENIEASLTWTENYFSSVDDWLRTNSASSLTAGLVLVLSFIVSYIQF